MPLMPMPPIPTKWMRRVRPEHGRHAASSRSRVHDHVGRIRFRHRAHCRSHGIPLRGAPERWTGPTMACPQTPRGPTSVDKCLLFHQQRPLPHARHKNQRVVPLMVIRRRRKRHKHGRHTKRREFRQRGGAGSASPPRRHWTHLVGDGVEEGLSPRRQALRCGRHHGPFPGPLCRSGAGFRGVDTAVPTPVPSPPWPR